MSANDSIQPDLFGIPWRTCRKCKQAKPITEFYKQRGFLLDRYSKCKECVKVINKEYLEKNRERLYAYHRAYHRRNTERRRVRTVNKTYGLSRDEYYNLVESQSNLCAICKKKEWQKNPRTGEPRRLAVDHDPKTGKVRGLLCTNCNQGLGRFKDNCENLEAAIRYLKASRTPKK